MKARECEISCDGKVCATIKCKEDEINIKCTEEGMKLCRGFKGCC